MVAMTGCLAAQRSLGVLADQHAGFVVVGGKQRIGLDPRGLSRAITCTPWARDLLDGGDDGIAPQGVIRMVLAPAATMFSIALIWPAVSPSCLPAAVRSLAPAFLAAASAPSFIFTKKGLLSVLVIRPITGFGGVDRGGGKGGKRDRGQRQGGGFFHVQFS